jgi:hypothetical protein
MVMQISNNRLALPFVAMALLLSGGAAQAVSKTSEQQLEETLAGYTAGEPVNCISQYLVRDVKIFDKTALLYEMSGDRYYLNIPESGARSLDHWDVLVTENWTSQLCNGDIVKLWDSTSRMETGFVGLGKFIPYTKSVEYE